jgi:hypothetical protein
MENDFVIPVYNHLDNYLEELYENTHAEKQPVLNFRRRSKERIWGGGKYGHDDGDGGGYKRTDVDTHSQTHVEQDNQTGFSDMCIQRNIQNLDPRYVYTKDQSVSYQNLDPRCVYTKGQGVSNQNLDPRCMYTKEQGVSNQTFDPRYVYTTEQGVSNQNLDPRYVYTKEQGVSNQNLEPRYVYTKEQGVSNHNLDPRYVYTKEQGVSNQNLDPRCVYTKEKGVQNKTYFNNNIATNSSKINQLQHLSSSSFNEINSESENYFQKDTTGRIEYVNVEYLLTHRLVDTTIQTHFDAGNRINSVSNTSNRGYINSDCGNINLNMVHSTNQIYDYFSTNSSKRAPLQECSIVPSAPRFSKKRRFKKKLNISEIDRNNSSKSSNSAQNTDLFQDGSNLPDTCAVYSNKGPNLQGTCTTDKTKGPDIQSTCAVYNNKGPNLQDTCTADKTKGPDIQSTCAIYNNKGPNLQGTCTADKTKGPDIQSTCAVYNNKGPNLQGTCTADKTKGPDIQSTCVIDTSKGPDAYVHGTCKDDTDKGPSSFIFYKSTVQNMSEPNITADQNEGTCML